VISIDEHAPPVARLSEAGASAPATNLSKVSAPQSAVSEQILALPLIGRREVAERTLEFRFPRPAGMTFRAGQFMDLTLIDPSETDAEGNTRGFSINGAPDEADLIFTTRLRDTAFKRVLRSMPLGTGVKIDGPFGNFTLHNDEKRPAILLAGGIGITPFRSIVRRAVHAKLRHQIILFYANHRPEDAPFLDEFVRFERLNPNFLFVPTMTRMEDSHAPWSGETGRVDGGMILRHVRRASSQAAAIYYIAGPPRMVAGLHQVLKTIGIDDDDIRMEDFAGY
jgi:ferredoxin-NADP reductase